MPVKVDEDTVMKAVSPGDRVDVMVFLRRNGQDIPETGAFTILRNVRVFAINTNTERASDEKGSAANFRTVSLLVKPDHAQELVVAAQMGKIMLTLRRPDETDEEVGEQVTPLKDILTGRSKLASEPADSSNSGPGFLGMLKGIVPPAQPLQPQPTGAPQPYKTMLVMTPNERKQYEWYDPNNPHELPVEVTLGGSVPTLAPPPAPPAPLAPVNPPTPSSESLENPDHPGVINAPAAGSDKSGAGKDAK
jgi:pilus assembly protein CpaB